MKKKIQYVIHVLRNNVLHILHEEIEKCTTIREYGFLELGHRVESAMYCLLLIDGGYLKEEEILPKLNLCTKLLYEIQSTLEKETEFVSPIEVYGLKRMIGWVDSCYWLVHNIMKSLE